jgi:hypothetical protein
MGKAAGAIEALPPRVTLPPPRRAHRPVSGATLAALRGRLGGMVAVRVRVLAKECHGLGGPSARLLWQVPSGLAQTQRTYQ